MTTKRVLIQAITMVLALPLFFSCLKDEEDEIPNGDAVKQEITLEESEATRVSVENLVDSYEGSLQDFAKEAVKLENIKSADINGNLVYLTTTAGGSICVDLYGTSFREQDDEGYSIDTCGTYIKNCLEEIERQYKDSIASSVKHGTIERDSIDFNYDDEEDVIETRATLHHRKILGKRKMAYWTPWQEMKDNELRHVEGIVKNYNLDFKFIGVSPSDFSLFSQYDLVFVSSHGAEDGSVVIPLDYEPLYCSKYRSNKNGKTYMDESAMAKDGISYFYSRKYLGLVKDKLLALKLDKRFFDSHLPDLSNTIICTSICYAGVRNGQFLQSAIGKGCPEYYGGDKVVDTWGPYSFFKDFLALFTLGSSAKTAYEFGARLMVKGEEYKYNYLRYGNTNVTYFLPFVTGTRNVDNTSAVVGVKFQYSADIPGSMNSETPNEYGIYITEDIEHGPGQHMPLSKSNVVNGNTVTMLNDAINAYYANVKIEGLNPNTRYYYFTYVVVGNKPLYSEEYDVIETTTQGGNEEAYVVLKDSVLTFYYDAEQEQKAGRVYKLPQEYSSYPEWSGKCSKVIFDPSFACYRPTSTENWFDGCSKLKTIENIQYLNTANVTDMSYMFRHCSSLTSLGLSSFNTANVTDMYRMFYDCRSLTSLDLSRFNTSNVTNMEGMFLGCRSLTSLDVSSFNTSNVTNMYRMFYDCRSLTSLDLSRFNTSNVTNMGDMFHFCPSLKSLDFRNLVLTGNNGGGLFRTLENLQHLNLSNANTEKATGMGGMFGGCSSLTSLDVSRFNTANVTDMSEMFGGCSSLTSLDVSRFNTANVTRMDGMFGGCSSLTSLDLSSFNTANVTNMRHMFLYCRSLKSLDFRNLVLTGKNGVELFSELSNLQHINLSNANTEKATSLTGMFWQCYRLKSLDLSSFNTSNVTEMGGMFWDCSSLTSLDLSSFNTANVTEMSMMFYDCSSLITIYAGNWNRKSHSDCMFTGCKNLVGGKGTKGGKNLYGYDKDGNPLYYYCYYDDADCARSAHIDGGKDDPGLFTAK